MGQQLKEEELRRLAEEGRRKREEQKKKMVERAEKIGSDPDFAKAVQADAMKNFTEADANNDGVLDEAEFMVFFQKAKEDTSERADFIPDYTEDQLKAGYEAMNKITPDKDGVVLTDIIKGRKALAMLMKQAQQQ